MLVMIPLILVLRQTKASYEVKKGGKKINHLLFMDDLKLFAKNEDQRDSLVNTVRIFSEDIKMEFGLPNCRDQEEGGYKYLGILEADDVKHEEMKGQIKKEYIRRVRNILKSKLN